MEIFKDLFAKIEAVKAEKQTAGTRFRLMGLAADITEVTQALQMQVLDVVSHEATGIYIDIHRPHPGSIMKEWMVKAIYLHLKSNHLI